MSIGELYFHDELVARISYQIQQDDPSNWWGELTLIDYKTVSETDEYRIAMEDGRTGRCYLKKRVNRAVSGIPTRYVYRFSGVSLLQ